MNSTKLFPWLLAALLLAGVCGYIQMSGPERGALSSASETVAKTTTASPIMESQTSPGLAEDGSRIKQLSPEGLAAKKRYDEAKTKAAKSFQKMAMLMTPEFRAKAAENIMQLRQDSYKKLFASWNLDTGKSREVLGILYAREIRRLDIIVNFSQDAYNPRSAKVKASGDRSEDLVTRELLNLSIGETRAAGLLDMVEQAEKAELAMAVQRSQKN